MMLLAGLDHRHRGLRRCKQNLRGLGCFSLGRHVIRRPEASMGSTTMGLFLVVGY
jgi:hypothetical protein